MLQAYGQKLRNSQLWDFENISAKNLENPNSPLYYGDLNLRMKIERHKKLYNKYFIETEDQRKLISWIQEVRGIIKKEAIDALKKKLWQFVFN